MPNRFWIEELGSGPIVAVAVHNGHEVRPDVAERMEISDDARLREEDPFTGEWTSVAPTRMIVTRSRFEMDLNRPRDKSVYRTPDDAWGLQVWNQELPESFVEEGLRQYDEFYDGLRSVLQTVQRKHGRFVVLDIHSYNHRRGGPDAPPEDPDANPQVNLGTGSLNRALWGPLADRFLKDLREYPFPGGPLDIRENVRFRGGHLSRWVHSTFPDDGCALAVEFKKFFMDEWTGEPNRTLMDEIKSALRATIPGLNQELSRTRS